MNNESVETRSCPFPQTLSGLEKRYGRDLSHTSPFAVLAILDVENGHCPDTPVLLNGCKNVTGTGIVLHAECICGNFHTSGFSDVEDVKIEWRRMCIRFGEEPAGQEWIRSRKKV